MSKAKSNVARMNGDVKWLLKQGIFGGHKFERFDALGMQRCATIVRAVIDREDFCTVLLRLVTSEREALEHRIEHSSNSDNAVVDSVSYAAWNGPLRFALVLEDVIAESVSGFDSFEAADRPTPAVHRKRYTEIVALAKDLMEALDQEPDLRGINHDPDFLPRLVELATDLAANPPLSKPKARNAKRIYVAKRVAAWFRSRTGKYRHAAAASLVNALFPDTSPVADEGYMQSLARKIKIDKA